VCTVHYNRAPASSATPHAVWNQNSLVVQIMFISSHEIEHLFSNKAQRLVYQHLRCRTKRQLFNTRGVADYWSTLWYTPQFTFPLFSSLLSQLSKLIILVPLTFFVTTAHICATMTRFDHDKFLLPFVKLSTSPYCMSISSQYNGIHYNDNAQHGAQYNSSKRTTLPLPGKSQCTHLSTINVHKARPIDSAHFAQPMSHNNT
jgi:hypothetical protein